MNDLKDIILFFNDSPRDFFARGREKIFLKKARMRLVKKGIGIRRANGTKGSQWDKLGCNDVEGTQLAPQNGTCVMEGQINKFPHGATEIMTLPQRLRKIFEMK